MKNHSLIYKTFFIILLISFGFYSCDDIPEYKLSKKIEDDPLTLKSFVYCRDSECQLLTGDGKKEWKLSKLYNEFSLEIPFDMWSDFNKDETISFRCDYTFQRKCYAEEFRVDPDIIRILELVTFSWFITERHGKKIFYLQLISDAEPPSSWMYWLDDEIFIQELTDDILKIMVDGRIREYRPGNWPGWY